MHPLLGAAGRPGRKSKNYRSKRSDKFKGPENALFDIADEPWIGAPAK